MATSVLLILIVIALGMAGLGKVILYGFREGYRKIRHFGQWLNEPEEKPNKTEEE